MKRKPLIQINSSQLNISLEKKEKMKDSRVSRGKKTFQRTRWKLSDGNRPEAQAARLQELEEARLQAFQDAWFWDGGFCFFVCLLVLFVCLLVGWFCWLVWFGFTLGWSPEFDIGFDCFVGRFFLFVCFGVWNLRVQVESNASHLKSLKASRRKESKTYGDYFLAINLSHVSLCSWCFHFFSMFFPLFYDTSNYPTTQKNGTLSLLITTHLVVTRIDWRPKNAWSTSVVPI